MKEFILNLLNNETFVWGIMAVIVFLLTNVIKIPIKHFTKRIKDEQKRRAVNSVILIFPFLLGLALDFAYSTFYLHTSFSILTGLGYGTAGISLYGVIERFFKVKIPNEWEDTEEGKKVVQEVENIKEELQDNQESAIEKFKRNMGK